MIYLITWLLLDISEIDLLFRLLTIRMKEVFLDHNQCSSVLRHDPGVANLGLRQQFTSVDMIPSLKCPLKWCPLNFPLNFPLKCPLKYMYRRRYWTLGIKNQCHPVNLKPVQILVVIETQEAQTGRMQRHGICWIFGLSTNRSASEGTPTAWDNIAKELNKVLAENGIASFRTGAQCKGPVKYLEEEYKKVKDHNSRSGNDNNQDSFDYFDELNDVLGCKPNIAPRHVVDSGLLDKPEEPTVSVDLTTLSFPDDQSPSTSTQSQDTSKQSSPATSEVEGRDKDDDEKDALVAEAESFFFNKKKATPGKKKAKGKESTPKVPKRARRGPESPDDDDKFFMHLESSQKKDHEFFERLAERGGWKGT